MYQEWLEHVTESERLELEQMSSELRNDCFYRELEFGTAGARGKLGLGPNRMNIYQVRKIVTGYAKSLQKQGKTKIAIAHDNRAFGHEFMEEATRVLHHFGVSVYTWESLRPTPLLSFTIRNLKLDGGINFTASHNPKEYQGIKLYNETGCQLIPVEVEPVMAEIEQSSYFDTYADAKYFVIDEANDQAYVQAVKAIRINETKDIPVVYTPLHGTGSIFIKDLLPNVITVEEQMVVDPNFTTTPQPNPEFKEAYGLALEYAEKHDALIALASDPDADRIGAAVKHNGEFVILTGNELAYLLLDYTATHKTFKNGIVMKSLQTSQLGRKIAERYGFEFVETLTGFKWMGTLMNETDKELVMAYEEANGCVLAPIVRDKDGMQGIYMLYEMACYYAAQGKTFIDQLAEIYKTYGHYMNETLNYVMEGQDGAIKRDKVMEVFRGVEFEGCLEKKDYLDDPLLTDNILKFTFEGAQFIVRPSGTEPKIKVYLEVVDNEALLEKYTKMVDEIIKNI